MTRRGRAQKEREKKEEERRKKAEGREGILVIHPILLSIALHSF